MRNYVLEDKYRYTAKSFSDGMQDKYYRNGYYYKQDKVGNEGYVEHLVSVLLSCSTLGKDEYVSYEYCKINNKLGCRSKSFLKENEEFITANKLYETMSGELNLANKLASMQGASDRLRFIVDLYSSVGINERLSLDYFSKVFLLDYIILNTDRHMRNIGVIKRNSSFRLVPIFDNGNSLDTDRRGTTIASTISGSFEEQLVIMRYPVVPKFKIYKNKLRRELNNIEDRYEKEVLVKRLRNNGFLFI